MNDVFTRFLFFYKIVLIFYIILVKEKLKKFPEVMMDDIIVLNQGIKNSCKKWYNFYVIYLDSWNMLYKQMSA